MTETTKDLQNQIDQLVAAHPEVGEWLVKARVQAINRKLAAYRYELTALVLVKQEATIRYINLLRENADPALQDAAMVVMHAADGCVRNAENIIIELAKEVSNDDL